MAGGARLALASSFDVDTFWEEVRRYGVTVVSYVWAQLRDIVEAPPNPFERHHAIRLLVGSGMPPSLWRRAEERLAPARVLEFWAATEGEAVLANVRDVKAGCQGRPLPDSAELRVARYDTATGQLVLASNGLALPARSGQARAAAGQGRTTAQQTIAPPLRSVFGRGDAWLSTETLFVRDSRRRPLADRRGEHAGPPSRGGGAVDADRAGAVPTLDAVDLVVTYGVEGGGRTRRGRRLLVSLRRPVRARCGRGGRTRAVRPAETSSSRTSSASSTRSR